MVGKLPRSLPRWRHRLQQNQSSTVASSRYIINITLFRIYRFIIFIIWSIFSTHHTGAAFAVQRSGTQMTTMYPDIRTVGIGAFPVIVNRHRGLQQDVREVAVNRRLTPTGRNAIHVRKILNLNSPAAFLLLTGFLVQELIVPSTQFTYTISTLARNSFPRSLTTTGPTDRPIRSATGRRSRPRPTIRSDFNRSQEVVVPQRQRPVAQIRIVDVLGHGLWIVEGDEGQTDLANGGVRIHVRWLAEFDKNCATKLAWLETSQKAFKENSNPNHVGSPRSRCAWRSDRRLSVVRIPIRCADCTHRAPPTTTAVMANWTDR